MLAEQKTRTMLVGTLRTCKERSRFLQPVQEPNSCISRAVTARPQAVSVNRPEDDDDTGP